MTIFNVLVFMGFFCLAIREPLLGLIMFLLSVMEHIIAQEKTIKNLRQEICELKNQTSAMK